MAVTDDGCRLWTTRSGGGDPLILCHGGPGFWDTFGGLAGTALLGHSWGAELALRYTLAHPGRVTRLVYVSGVGIDPESTWHAERETTPFLGADPECSRARNADRRRILDHELLCSCQTLKVPVLLVDGARDLRPRWAVDSLERALPDVRRVVLPDAGHLPWVEAPAAFRTAVTGFLAEHRSTNIPATSLRISFSPRNEPAVTASDQGTPMTKATGAHPDRAPVDRPAVGHRDPPSRP